ncbi:unnamed protein product [Lymnaea stagnalis]|uniref:Uncharacterized protein n=1 Tax=Lymnaea stagnalis TaxID=6523 RepID=A0AAV2HRX5_LYMST
MKTIFKNFIMPADIYGEWLTNRNRERDSALKIDVKVSLFPALNFLMGLQTEVKLSNEDNEKAKTGKEVVRKARTQWAEMSKNLFRQPSLLRYILLKRTIFLSLSIMNDLYQNYLTKKMIGQQSAKKRKFSWLK